MVAYNFNARFIAPIRAGAKCQTIRKARARAHAAEGDMLQLYAGLRMAGAEKIIPDTLCTGTSPIVIEFNDAMQVTRIETWGMPVRDLHAFARRDGFDGIHDMELFWEDLYGKIARFEGTVIEWAPPAGAVAKAVAA